VSRWPRLAGIALQALLLGALLAFAILRWVAAGASADFHYQGY
jgi:hypothetical protein